MIASLRYRDELFRSTEESWRAFRQRSDRNQEQQTLAIELILGAEKAMIALSLPKLAGGYGQLRLIGKQPVKSWRVNGDYVRKNMLKIIADSFRLEKREAEQRMNPLWPQTKAAAGN